MNLSVRTDLASRAKALKLNLSQIMEAALEEAIRKAERGRWLDENEEAFAEYNVGRCGVFSDARRRF